MEKLRSLIVGALVGPLNFCHKFPLLKYCWITFAFLLAFFFTENAIAALAVFLSTLAVTYLCASIAVLIGMLRIK